MVWTLVHKPTGLQAGGNLVKARLDAAQYQVGIRDYMDDNFLKLLEERYPHLGVKSVRHDGKLHTFPVKIEDSDVQLYISLPARSSFLSLEQALSVFEPIEMPMLADALGLEWYSPHFLPCHFTEVHDKTRTDVQSAHEELGPGIRWRYELELCGAQCLHFAVFIARADEHKKAELLSYVETLRDTDQTGTKLITIETGEQMYSLIFCIDAYATFLRLLREKYTAGRLLGTYNPLTQVERLRQTCLNDWQAMRSGSYFS